MHPFNFTAAISFACIEPDSAFVFEPVQNKFHWFGKELDKLGRYTFIDNSPLELELEWNYGREQAYAVVSFEGTGDNMTNFVLQNRTTGQRYSFSR
jgi:hypothetical protein